MDKELIFKEVRAIMKSIRKNDKIDSKERKADGTHISRKYLRKIGERSDLESLKDYYDYYNELLVIWCAKNLKVLSGKINALPLDQVFINYENFVYFDHTPADSPLRDFKIIDFFVDEACVGIYVGRDDLPGMHFFEFENEAYPLHVDFEGYLKLLGVTKGYLYWQKVILDHLNNRETPITKEFKDNMPKLFDDFEFDQLISLYEEVRIDK